MKDYNYLSAYAQICVMETGIEVDTRGNEVVIDGTCKHDRTQMNDCFALSPFEARLLSDALLEAATIAETEGMLLTQPTKGSA